MPDSHRIPLYLFAKEPVAGRVKTRMQPELSATQCESLARHMLEQSAETVAAHWKGELVLCVTPSCEAQIFKQLASRLGCEIVAQSGNDLGDRMAHALLAGIEQAGAAVVMGCDVPYCSPEILQSAWQILNAGDSVVGPAEDGGFYLFGTREMDPSLFASILWGGDRVLENLQNNANKLGMKMRTIETLRDIDRPDDLIWLSGIDPEYKRYFEKTGQH